MVKWISYTSGELKDVVELQINEDKECGCIHLVRDSHIEEGYIPAKYKNWWSAENVVGDYKLFTTEAEAKKFVISTYFEHKMQDIKRQAKAALRTIKEVIENG